MAYGPSGNITSKGSHTNYQYQPARPHAVSAVTTPGGVRNYSYDLNGNLIQVTGPAARSVTWWSFNKPRRLERDANNHAEYWYGPGGDRAVFRQSACIHGVGRDTTTKFPHPVTDLHATCAGSPCHSDAP